MRRAAGGGACIAWARRIGASCHLESSGKHWARTRERATGRTWWRRAAGGALRALAAEPLRGLRQVVPEPLLDAAALPGRTFSCTDWLTGRKSNVALWSDAGRTCVCNVLYSYNSTSAYEYSRVFCTSRCTWSCSTRAQWSGAARRSRRSAAAIATRPTRSCTASCWARRRAVRSLRMFLFLLCGHWRHVRAQLRVTGEHDWVVSVHWTRPGLCLCEFCVSICEHICSLQTKQLSNGSVWWLLGTASSSGLARVCIFNALLPSRFQLPARPGCSHSLPCSWRASLACARLLSETPAMALLANRSGPRPLS